jgi:predicted amidohydrolase
VANLGAIEHFGAEAAQQGATIVVTPEMSVTGYCWPDESEVRAVAEPLEGPSVQALTRIAQSTGAWFVAGLPEIDRDLQTLHNTCVLVSPDGLEGAYRKTHPFLADPFWAVDGNDLPPVWQTPAGRVSPLICADLDYPEPPRSVALLGADWVAFPTAWVDEPGPSATWRIRAWENALPIVAADMAGSELGVQFSGGSCILDHRGTPVAAIDDGDGFVIASLDLDAGAAARRSLLASRRPAEYRPLALSRRWARPAVEALFGTPASTGDVKVAVLTAPPGELPDPPSGTQLAVLPGFHLCGGAPSDRFEAEARASRWQEGLEKAASLARSHACEVVTSLVEPGEAGCLHHCMVAVGGDAEVVTRRATHLGQHDEWATPGDGTWLAVPRPWGRLALLAGEELAPFEPSRICAIRDADVLAVPAALSWPWPVDYLGTQVPLGAELQAPDPYFAHLARLRAGDSNVWLAFANWEGPPAGEGRTPSGIFAPDHYKTPRVEKIAEGAGWELLKCGTRGPNKMGAVCESKHQLVRRRTDIYAEVLIRPTQP